VPGNFSFGTRKIMNLNFMIFSKKTSKVFTRKDCTESDLIQYCVDHLKTAEKLYELSGRWTWEYLHSAAFLSHLGIELLLKSCLLHFENEFPAIHDLKRLFGMLQKKGITLSDQNKKWLNYLNECNALRYPNETARTKVDINQWGKTKALFEELRGKVPVEIQKQIVIHERYRSNVKSGKTIWPG
jgi:HEPN domain-containing protein